jgi:hypothetical protein
MIGVSRYMLDGSNSQGMVNPRDLGIVSKYLFVPVILKSPLFLRIRIPPDFDNLPRTENVSVISTSASEALAPK